MFRHCLLLTAVCLLTFFAGLGRSAIGDSDEAFYAESAREMIESGDWVTPHYNYDYRFQKPIFFYWLVAATYQVAGVGEAAARFPSALAGLALTLMTFACGRRWFGQRTGLVAGLIVATSFGYFPIARSSLPDLPLTFFISLATWTLLEAVLGPPAATRQTDVRDERASAEAAAREQRWWLIASAVAMGFGLLTKGPVAVALPVMIVIPLALMARKPWLPSASGWLGLNWGQLLTGTAVFLVVALPWFIAMVGTHGTAYLDRFFVGENLERFTTERYNDRRPIWFYVPILLGGLAPWSPLVFLWVPSVRRVLRGERRGTDVEWRAVMWAAVPFLFYTLSVGQQPRYILPVLPPLALLVAQTLLTRIDSAVASRQRHLGLAICATCTALGLIVLAVLLHRARPLLFALSPTSGIIGTTLVVVAALGLVYTAWFARHTLLPAALSATGIATLLALHYSVYSAAGLEPVQRMARLFAQERQHGEPSGTYRTFVRNLVFYTGVKQNDLVDERETIEFLAQPERVLCVLSEDDLRTIERSGVRIRRLASVPYFNPSGVRLRTLLWPQPERDLETVWLVSNQ